MRKSEEPARSLASMLQASSLAIVGSSERARWARQIFSNLRQFGYGGRIVLVNPRQRQVFGENCLSSLRELSAPVDHALVIVPAAHVAEVLGDAEAAGIQSAKRGLQLYCPSADSRRQDSATSCETRPHEAALGQFIRFIKDS